MFATFKQVFRSTNKDLRNRIFFTLGALFIFALGNAITVPGMQAIIGDLGFLELLNAMAGGGLKRFSIFALGVTPYISMSIVMQLLQLDIIPYFKELKEQGEEGRRKINKINRYGGIIIAFLQGYLFSIMFIGDTGTPMTYLKVATILAAGTAFLLWLGDQITSKGIGNGISMIIMAGIVNTIPSMLGTAFETFVPTNGTGNLFIGILSYVLFLLIYVSIIVGIIWIENAERRIPIQYSNRSNGSYGSKQTYLPMKINTAGVMPVIFASTLISIPTTITYFVDSEKISLFITKYLSYTTVPGFILYMVLIFIFAYFYVFIALNPDEVSKNLNKSGGYIPGIRPGKDTAKYVRQVLSRITLLGALFLAVLSAIPILFTVFTKLPSTVSVGGTSLLIVVGVLLETYKQLESSVASRGYKKGY